MYVVDHHSNCILENLLFISKCDMMINFSIQFDFTVNQKKMNFPGDDVSTTSLASIQDSAAFEENERFNKHGPLLNLMILTVGPFLTTFGMSVMDSIDLIIISQRFKNDPNSPAVSLIGMGTFIVQVCIFFGLFMSQALVVRVSGLIGEGRREAASQLTVDVCRVSLIASIFFALFLLFFARPLMLFAGCTEDLIENCYLLIISTIAGLPLYSFYHLLTGFLQGIGKPVLNGLVHLAANCLQTLVFTPLLQFVFKVDMTLSNIALPLSQSIFGLLLIILIFKGKFSLKPTWEMWFRPFSKEIKTAFLMALPFIPTFVFMLLPPTLILRFMTEAASKSTDANAQAVISAYTVCQKVLMIAQALPAALGVGFISAGTHSIASSNFKRFISTFVWVIVIALGFVCIYMPIIMVNPLLISKLFVSSEIELNICKSIIPIPFYTYPIAVLDVIFPQLYVAAGKPFLSTITLVLQCVSICVSAKIISVKFPDDPSKLMYAYNCCDLFTLVFNIISFIIVIVPIIRKLKDQNQISLTTQLLN